MHSDLQERGLSADFEQVFVFKMLEVLDEIKNYLLDTKIGKITKKLREKQKFQYPDNVMTKLTSL